METVSTVLGLDLGTSSIGWAILKKDSNELYSTLDTGARIFPEGLEDLQTDGKGSSRNLARRDARLIRRRLERTARRMTKLANALQKAGLLPDGNLSDSQPRHEFLTKLDVELGSPYKLRARALDEKLTQHELGRAVYHLAQRRGFLSNRKTAQKNDEDLGKVKGAIKELGELIESKGARTLGDFFSKLDSRQERIRGRYTSRAMYESEFSMIWEAQSKYYPDVLTDELQKHIHTIIFYQRPLKSQKHLIGKCELEPKRKRAPWAILESQRFRLLQTVNNLALEQSPNRNDLTLTEEERGKIIEALETDGDLKFPKIRELLSLKRSSKFNLELGGEKRIIGNRTASKLRQIFGVDRWQSMSIDEQNAVVEDIRCIVSDETLRKRAENHWKLDEENAEKLSTLALDEGYCNFSRQAIARLLPFLEKGTPLQTAIKECYPERWNREHEPLDELPMVKSELLPELRNPIVERTLSELRKVVNHIIRKHGKPTTIRIELARDLKQSAKQRGDTTKKMRANESQRKKAAARISTDTKITNPSRDDILKVQLAEECGWVCPYTGESISMSNLLGANPKFDIEHIIPFSRSLDNSFLNKTLCLAEENRNVKGSKTPYETYYGTDKWDEIITRVRKFKSDVARIKLQRFEMNPEDVATRLTDFSSRQLNDTRYASKQAMEYLSLLYGGIDSKGIDSAGKLRVQSTVGQATAYLRGVWGLNSILSDGPKKSRDDHRHHSIDAIVVALTDSKTIKSLSDAAGRAQRERRHLFGKMDEPTKAFYDNVKQNIDSIVVSHRVSRRVRGALHNESFYGQPYEIKGKSYIRIRKPIESLSAKDIDKIVDPAIRKIVRDTADGNPGKAFKEAEKHPRLLGKNGSSIPIHSVRIERALNTFPVGEKHRVRNVQSDGNHHIELYELFDENGKTTKWEGYVVSLFEAYQRLRNKQDVVDRKHVPGRRFLFSLAKGESIELDNENGQRKLYVVQKISKSTQVKFMSLNDARKKSSTSAAGLTALPDPFRKLNCRKVVVTPLGDVRYAND